MEQYELFKKNECAQSNAVLKIEQYLWNVFKLLYPAFIL